MNLPPLSIRKLRATMELKGLNLQDVSTLSGVPYNTCCQILKGRLINPERLAKITSAIKEAEMPEEACS